MLRLYQQLQQVFTSHYIGRQRINAGHLQLHLIELSLTFIFFFFLTSSVDESPFTR